MSEPAVRVTVDGRSLVDGSAFRGIGTYLRGLLGALARREDVEVTVIASGAPALPAAVRLARTMRLAPGRFSHREHDLLLPVDLALRGGDVVHSPAQEPPRFCRAPWVQTLHGMAPFSFDAVEYAGERQMWLRNRKRLQRASAFIAVSRCCADDSIRYLGISPRLVHVAHHGVDPTLRDVDHTANEDSPYLLYVGEYGPSKGFAEAMAVAAGLADDGQPIDLKMAGRLVPWTEPAVRDLRAASGAANHIDLVGHVPADRMRSLYSGALALIVTSRYESFCLPMAEAMACGTPVIAFDNSALPEISGGAALLVPDGDVAEMIRTVQRLRDSRSEQNERGAAGRERSRFFDWDSSAGIHAEIFRASRR